MCGIASGIRLRDARQLDEGRGEAMGLRRGESGDGRPPDDGLPDLPPEWGVVVVPDDLTELDRETSELRRQRRRVIRRNRWRRRLGLTPLDPDADMAPIGAPLFIMSITIIAALASLLAITLSSRPVQRTTTPPHEPVAAVTTHQMINLSLPDTNGRLVPIRSSLPAVILLLDGCQCDQLIRDTAKFAPTKVTLLLVDRNAPIIPGGIHATALIDSEQALLATYGNGPDRRATPAGVAAALLVNVDGVVVRTVLPATSVSDFQADLVSLAN
jgi:hypothetical protein